MSRARITASAREAAGAVLVTGVAGSRLEPATRALLADLQPAGIILFARNVGSADELRALTTSVRDALDDPLVLVDQEGGRVDRLKAWRGVTPSARELASRGIEAVSEEARETARDLASLGINFNCVPVIDLDEGQEGNGIGDRAFGADPAHVVACARAVIEAHRARGIATSLKHFPGLGRTRLDTHLGREALDLSLQALRERELVPFRMLADECDAVMISHVALPSVTGSDAPASLSRAVIDGLLRQELGFDGLVVSDDLGMGAVADRSPGEQAIEALAAGCDLLLYCGEIASAIIARDAIVAESQRSERFAARVSDAGSRVRLLRRRLGSTRLRIDGA